MFVNTRTLSNSLLKILDFAFFLFTFKVLYKMWMNTRSAKFWGKTWFNRNIITDGAFVLETSSVRATIVIVTDSRKHFLCQRINADRPYRVWDGLYFIFICNIIRIWSQLLPSIFCKRYRCMMLVGEREREVERIYSCESF